MTREIRQRIEQKQKTYTCEIYARSAHQMLLGDGYFVDGTGEFVFVSIKPPTQPVAVQELDELHLDRGGIYQGVEVRESSITPEGRFRCVLAPVR